MRVLRLWGPVVLWMAVIFLFSARQRVVVSETYILNFLFFKMLHVIEYAVLFTFTYRATKDARTAFAIVILYAISDEVHQLFVPTREGALRDVIIDALGAAVAWIQIRSLLPKMQRKRWRWVREWLET